MPVIGFAAILANRGIFFAEVVNEWLEFLVSVQVALEVLQEDDFFVDGLGVLKEVEGGHLICDTLCGLSVGVECRLLLGALNVVEME